jgi:hypothetical protein
MLKGATIVQVKSSMGNVSPALGIETLSFKLWQKVINSQVLVLIIKLKALKDLTHLRVKKTHARILQW